VFRNPVSLQAGIGSAVGISGVLLYSLTKQHYEELEKIQSQEANQGKRGARRVPAKKIPVKATSRKRRGM
jgi:solute carrier family 35 protein E1